jgi:hypothetical protein
MICHDITRKRVRRLRSGIWAVVLLTPIAAFGQAVLRPDPSLPSNGGEDASEADREAYPLRVSLKLGEGSVLIKAPKGVRPAALTKARDKIRAILADADAEVVVRLGASRLAVVVVPHTGRFTDLPDLRDLAGSRNAFGQSLDLARGIFRSADHEPMPPTGDARSGRPRPTRDSPMVAVGEEDILRLVPCGPQSALHHELAHAVHVLGLSPEQRTSWRELYEDARRRGLFKGRYASLNEGEFFAELSEAYFDVAPYFCSRPQLARVDRPAFDWLAKVYSVRRPVRATAGSARPG